MELRAMRAFTAVVKTGSFTRAAEQLCVTQSTISKLILQLEGVLGHTLLVRNKQQLRLTPAGELVLQHAEQVLQHVNSMKVALDELNGLLRGSLSIGIPPLGPSLFVPVISLFKLRYPNIELKLFEDGSRAIEQRLHSGELDFGGLLAPLNRTLFHRLPMLADQLVLVSPRHSCWRQYQQVALADLSEEPFILFSDSYTLNQHILNACQQAGFSPHIAGQSGQISFILELVRSGVGIALLPGSALSQFDRSQFSVAALGHPAIPWCIELAWLRGGPESVARQKWLQVFAEVYSDLTQS